MFWGLTEKVYYLHGHCWSHVVRVTHFPASKSPSLENYLFSVALVSVIIKTLFKPSLILDVLFTVWIGLRTIRPCQPEEVNGTCGDLQLQGPQMEEQAGREPLSVQFWWC